MNPQLKPLLYSILPGVIIFLASLFISFLNAILLGIFIGIILGNLFLLSSETRAVSNATGNRFLELSVLFLAFGINYNHLANLGWKSLALVFLLVIIILSTTFFMSRKPLNWLIGFGTAICGSSAIAALAPSVVKDKGDTGIAMAVVNLYGMLGMVLLPLVLTKLDLEPISEALIIGGSLHSVGNVAGAGYIISNEVGEMAVTVKLARVALLSFGLVFFNFLTQNRKDLPWTDYIKMPWYVWGFLAITVLVSMVTIPETLLKWIEMLGKLLLTIAMTNIGMQIRFSKIIQSGKKGLILGLGIWLFQLAIIAAFLFLT